MLGFAWIACRQLDPLTVAFCELVFEPCAKGTDVWTTPQEWICSQHRFDIPSSPKILHSEL